MYFGMGFAFLTLVLDGPILLGALGSRCAGRCAPRATLAAGPSPRCAPIGTVFLHELCHCLAARYYGGTIDAITLWRDAPPQPPAARPSRRLMRRELPRRPFGGMSFVGHMGNAKGARPAPPILLLPPKKNSPAPRAAPLNPRCRRRAEDMIIAAAGPASHIVQALFWLILGAELGPASAPLRRPPAPLPPARAPCPSRAAPPRPPRPLTRPPARGGRCAVHVAVRPGAGRPVGLL